MNELTLLTPTTHNNDSYVIYTSIHLYNMHKYIFYKPTFICLHVR